MSIQAQHVAQRSDDNNDLGLGSILQLYSLFGPAGKAHTAEMDARTEALRASLDTGTSKQELNSANTREALARALQMETQSKFMESEVNAKNQEREAHAGQLQADESRKRMGEHIAIANALQQLLPNDPTASHRYLSTVPEFAPVLAGGASGGRTPEQQAILDSLTKSKAGPAHTPTEGLAPKFQTVTADPNKPSVGRELGQTFRDGLEFDRTALANFDTGSQNNLVMPIRNFLRALTGSDQEELPTPYTPFKRGPVKPFNFPPPL